MRQEINENEVEKIVGGTVILSKDYNTVAFSTTRQKFSLQNCTYRQARDYVEDLKDENPGLSNAEFDALAMKKLQAKGWI